MHGSLGVLSTQYGGFLALIVIGGLAGWIAGKLIGARHGIFTNIIVGVAGAWIGSEIADLAHVTVHGTIEHFVAALVGSAALLYIWQLINKRG
jgi:uncharacterized membrane protein YeaQ/YmgE (transglycosylase-associated protein family)